MSDKDLLAHWNIMEPWDQEEYGNFSNFRELMKARTEIKELKTRMNALMEFVSACRYAGADGLDRLQSEARALYASYTLQNSVE